MNELKEGDIVEECPGCHATGVVEFTTYYKGEMTKTICICDRCDGVCYIKHECDDCQRDIRADIPNEFSFGEGQLEG